LLVAGVESSMSSVTPTYLAVSVVATAVCLVVTTLAVEHRDRPGALALVGTMAAAVVWQVTKLAAQVSPTPAAAMVWVRLSYVGVTLVAASVFLFALAYTRQRRSTELPLVVAALLVEPALVLALVWTNPAHGLVWDPVTTPALSSGLTAGPAFWLHVAYAYLLVVASLGLFGRAALRSGPFYRTQLLVVIAGLVVPLLANAGYLLVGLAADPTPLSFAVTGVAWWVAISRYRFFQLSPVARNRLVAEMDDGVFVVDGDRRVVDYNRSACRIAGVDDPLGMALPDLVPDEVVSGGDCPDEVAIEREGSERYFDVKLTPLGDVHATAGSLVVLRDVTELRRREQELARLKSVMSRFLRHNLRNDLNVVMLRASEIADDGDDHAAAAADIHEMATQLVEKSRKARVVEQVIDNGERRTTVDAAADLRRAVADVARSHPSVAFETAIPEHLWTRAVPFCYEAFRNVLENAARHSDASEPRVRVEATDEHGVVHLTISDNGSGIPDAEIRELGRPDEEHLEHGSGIGLYLVDWIVDKSGGTLAFADDNTTVELIFEAATPPDDADRRQSEPDETGSFSPR
jgi:signal transduction histidine kinase